MRLFEVNDPFTLQQQPFTSIGDEYQHLTDRLTALQDRYKIATEKSVEILTNGLRSAYTSLGWKEATPAEQSEKLATGHVEQFQIRHDGKVRLAGWIKVTPANKSTVEQFQFYQQRMLQLKPRIVDLEEQLEKCKTRFNAWKRRQPGYVGRDETQARERRLGEKLSAAMNAKFGTIMRFWHSRTKQRGDSLIYCLTNVKIPAARDWKESNKKFLKPEIELWLKANGYFEEETRVSISSRIKTPGKEEFEVRISVPTKEVIAKNAT